MEHFYRTHGACSQAIQFDLDEGVVRNIAFFGGCNGNLNGIAKLVEGQRAEDVIEKLDGTRCGGKPTSCPDQLAKALRIALEDESQS